MATKTKLIHEEYEVATPTGSIAIVDLCFNEKVLELGHSYADCLHLEAVIDSLQCGETIGELFDIDGRHVGSWSYDGIED